jgi:hypothetical protein
VRAATFLVAILTVVACGTTSPPAYEALRQATRQEIPGAFGYDLVPVGDFRPSVDPSHIWPDLPGAGTGSDVSVTLAVVVHPTVDANWGPAWVFFTNDLCYFTAKGDYVSPSRAGESDGCRRQNMLVQVVDATSGEFEAVFEAYDADLTWLPDRLGTPAQVAGSTRFQ